MSPAQFFSMVRQYNQLSERTKKSYAPQVDSIAALFVESEAQRGTPDALTQAQVQAMVDREYNPLFRNYPVAARKAV